MITFLLFIISTQSFAQTVSWDAVENAQGYKVNYEFINSVEDCQPEPYLKYSADAGDALSYDLHNDPNFIPDQAYKVQISAYRGPFHGELSEDTYCMVIGQLDVIHVRVDTAKIAPDKEPKQNQGDSKKKSKTSK